MSEALVSVNLILPQAYVEKALVELRAWHGGPVYSMNGRGTLLNDVRGWPMLWQRSDVVAAPVEVLSFFTTSACEENLLRTLVSRLRLDLAGRGSIFSTPVKCIYGNEKEVLGKSAMIARAPAPTPETAPLYTDLTQVLCALGDGSAHDVARILLRLGFAPVVTGASGVGLRERLGLLRITIPREKELLSVVVGSAEAPIVMEHIIQWGKLDRPGRGFVWRVPLSRGLIDVKTTLGGVGQAASLEQVVAAIDSLKGSLAWRQTTHTLTPRLRAGMYKGTEFLVQVPEGNALSVAQEIQALGISGATVQSLRTAIATDKHEAILTPMEQIRIFVPSAVIERFLERVRCGSCLFLNEGQGHIFVIESSSAFNYKISKK